MYYNDKIYYSIGNKIKVSNNGEDNLKKYIEIKELGILNYFELYNRLLRHGIHNFYKINEEIDCVVIRWKILFFKNRNHFRCLNLEDGPRPMRNGIIFKEDYIVYTEYYGNKDRKPVNIYKYNFIEDRKEILYTFNNIRHIHCIHEDINDLNNIYIGTGDFDEECGIYKLNLKSFDMEKIGAGSQIWRAVSILQNNNSLYWGTDDPIGENYIMKYNLENDELERIKKIDGPAYYSTITKNNNMFIATTIEDRKKHKAIIYRSSNGDSWDKYMEFKKDIFHEKYFRYGSIEFINNQNELHELTYNLNGLK